MNNIYTILENTCKKDPDGIALRFRDHEISYNIVKDAADRLANGLRNIGFVQGDRVALMLPNIPHFPICYFALLKLGCIIVPVPVHCQAEEIGYQLNDSGAKGIIYWHQLRKEVEKAISESGRKIERIVLGEKAEAGEVRLTYLIEINDPMEEITDVGGDDTAVISYTSGTTGRPKGVMLSHKNILSNIDSCCKYFKFDTSDSMAGVFPLTHMVGQTVVMGSFFNSGGCVVLIPKFSGADILETIEREKVTYFTGTPFMITEMLGVDKERKYDLSSLKYCISTGDALKAETFQEFESRFNVSIIEGYGLTEASPMVSFNSLVRERKPGSIGLPLPGVEMKIIDESGQEVKPGEVGEIIVQGPNIMKGYLNRPDENEKALRDGWLYTGDFAQLQENGFGFIVVRERNVIVKSGFNVYPREIEAILLKNPKIKEAAVLGLPDPDCGEEIYACIVLQDGEEASEEEIIKYAKEHMAPYMCPKVIHFASSLPKNQTGKIMRDCVKELIIEKNK